MIKRIIIFITAIFLCGLGIAVTTQANLGTTPISSLPYVLTFIIPLSFGTTTFIINMLFILAQILILKKDFKKIQYLQVFVTLFFSCFIDFGMYIAEPFKSENYFARIIMLIAGSAILALGVTFEVIADIMYVPGEGIVRAITCKTNKNFGKMKILFDISQCIIAIILSLIFCRSIQGLREGTIIASILVGTFVCVYSKIYKKLKCINNY